MVRRTLLVLLATLGLAAPAQAATQTMTLRAGPYTLDGFETLRPRVTVPTPPVDGYVTHMDAWLIHANGRRVPIRRVMMHHVVFINLSSRLQACAGRGGQPFFGTGEEREKLVLPRGYGYPVHAADAWRMQTMLMSHSLETQHVYVQYRMRIVTGRRLTPVVPLWLRANGCAPNPSYEISGGGAPGETHVRSSAWRMPIDGRIVAAGAHLHGSAKNLTVTEPQCGGRVLFEQRPRYARQSDTVYRIRPVLHEPGPVATGYFLSRTGIPVRRGQPLVVTGMYDATRPHPQVMSITHVYIARGRPKTAPCSPLPADRRIMWTRHDGTFTAPVVTVPLNGLDSRGRVVEIDHPAGPTVVAGLTATVDILGGQYRPANLSVARGAKITWRWRDPIEHNLMIANGPRDLTGPISTAGYTRTRVLDVPGTYKLFCSLHPITMQEVVTVRDDPAPPVPPPPA